MSKEKVNERISNRMDPAKKTGSMKLPLIIAFVIIILVAVIVVIGFATSEKTVTTKKAYNTVVTPDNVEELVAELEEEDFTPIGSYEVNMNFDWVFADGASASENAYVGNSINNLNTVYFTIALSSNMDEIIYTSPHLEVGSHLTSIKLDKDLDPGTYEAVATYYLLDADMAPVSEVSVILNLTIKN